MDAAVPGLTIYNLPEMPPKWDAVGIFYITFGITWTVIVFGAMAFCWFNRHSPALRLRGLPLSFSAIAFLHCYWFLAQVVYPIGGTMDIVLAYDIQYFFMGIWFPLGIALFHASNLRFLHVAKLQRQFTQHPTMRVKSCCDGKSTSWLCWIRSLPYTAKIMLFIGTGMVAQVLLTIGMWFACEKYHPTFGIPGTGIKGETLPEQVADLGRGWEWWPTLLWQFIWAWIVAPILIWRAWGIRDTHGWRVQTIGCCIANLHAAPMFLVASYAPAFAKVNAYYAPSQWIHLSIMVFEIFTVFIPLYQVIRHRTQTRRAIASNSKWETASQATTLHPPTSAGGLSYSSTANLAEKGGISASSSLDNLDEVFGVNLLTMGALEHVLNENPAPLLEFSALSDFSGENIAFLTRVAQWKASASDGEARLEAFNRALDLYTDFISPRDAEFPLNLSSRDLRQLEDIFEDAARLTRGESRSNPATPFDFPDPESPSTGTANPRLVDFVGEVPEAFSMDVLDHAQSHVKYLVLTNTWPKFVSEMQNRRRSIETMRSASSAGTETTLTSLSSRVASIVKSIF